MKSIGDNDFIKEYAELASIQEECTLNGNYKLGNKCVNKLRKMVTKYCNNDEFAVKVLEELLHYNNDNVKSWAAVDLLKKNLLVESAVKVLEKISERTDIIGGDAKMALRVYNGEFGGKL